MSGLRGPRARKGLRERMVIYFSATGNTKYVAERLAELLEDEACDLCPRIRGNDFSQVDCGKTLVVCSPVHISGLPKFLSDYLKRVSFSGPTVAYGVLTDGGYAGIAGHQLKKILKKKGMRFGGFAEFVLPGIHITSITSRKIGVEEIESRIRVTSERLPEIARAIGSGEALTGKRTLLPEVALTEALMPGLRFVGLRTRKFWASDQCVSCGLCERVCPVVAITMCDGRPTWNMSHCAHCMACIHNCPKEAIEYGDITKDKRRYTFAKYRYAARGQEENL